MRGRIRSRQVCPICGQRGQHQLQDLGRGRRALVCACGQPATLLEIQLKWQNRVVDITRDQSGRRLTDYVHAERALGQINNQIESGFFLPETWAGTNPERLIWENYLAEYLTRERARCSRATWQRKRALARHLAWFNGKSLRDIRTGHLEDYEALPCLRMALEPKTRADLIQMLGHLFRRAVARDELTRAPQLPVVEVPQKPVRWMNRAQQEKALAQIPLMHQPIFRFLMQYGCRVSEACALCWDCVDPATGLFYLARTFSRRKLSETTKTRRSKALPIVSWFEAYLAGQPRGISRTPVFQNPDADPDRNPSRFYISDFLGRLWARALEAAGLPKIELKNATRHSAGNQLRREGWDSRSISRLLGHTSTQHTDRFYLADEVDMLREKLAALPPAKNK